MPFPPGGSTDTLARTLGASMQAKLGQTVIIENKAGATGTIGTAQVARAPADGHTVLVSSLGPLVIAPHLLKNVPYDAGKDLDLLTVAVQAPNVLVVPAASPYKTVADVIAAAKKSPDKLTFASSGNGSSDHLTAELFWLQTGTSGVHVPYKGGAPAVSDLLGGGGSLVPEHQCDRAARQRRQAARAGRHRLKRSALMPAVPTLAESGVKDADVYSWQGIAAPKGLPADVKAKLHAALIAALNDPAVKPKLLEVGFEIVGNTPAEFAAFQAAESARWKKLIEARKITAD
ncbi:tripartite tricarboxylate transporter substrate binding protein [Piscinibacter aquaticus]|uniref:Tripartite tricarboxylate transporter substrate binding protein n=1 Tax=Piscinibacter aquaticus TaxID=392597 RepID=A0A5C6U1C4_9BURK|nr:tripartite tricarboxylate transporter substrate binding protein [Piscinibacter aquaticus]